MKEGLQAFYVCISSIGFCLDIKSYSKLRLHSDIINVSMQINIAD